MISICILENKMYVFSAKKNIGTVFNASENEYTYISVPTNMKYDMFHDIAMESCKIAHQEFKEFNDLTQQFYLNKEVQKAYPIFFNRR